MRWREKIKIELRVIKMALQLAIEWLRKEPLRTTLSLLTISVGVFTIVALLTSVEALERAILGELERVGSSTLYIQQFPLTPSKEEQFEEVMKRPPPTYQEYRHLKERLTSKKRIAFIAMGEGEVSYQTKKRERALLIGQSEEWDLIASQEIASGRHFSPYESGVGASVAVIGSEIAKELFGESKIIGETIRVSGRPFTVVGLFKKEGESLFSPLSCDNLVALPYNSTTSLRGFKGEGTLIATLPNEGVGLERFREEIRAELRSLRRLRPTDSDNFAINSITSLLTITEELTSLLSSAGWLIGGFSLLIGAIGISNLLFLSVKEQTPYIGIQKAVGAKPRQIMVHYLIEALLLSLAGAVIAITILMALIALKNERGGLTLILSPITALKGVGVAIVIGTISSYLPAKRAAKITPMEAIRSR